MLDRPNPNTGQGHNTLNGAGFSMADAAPEKRPLFRELPSAAPYPVDALGPLKPAAEAIHLLTQAPLELCAQSVLAAATLAIQAHHDVILPGGGQKPLTGIFASVAESGERKSSVDKLALRAVAAFEARERERHGDALAAFNADKAAWREAAEKAKKKGNGDRAAIRTALLALGGEPKPPPLPMLLVADPTPEGIVMHLAESRPWAGVFTAEGGILVGGSAFNDETRMRTGALLNVLWDGDPIRRVRVGTGSHFLPGRRSSMHVMMQQVVAAKLLGDDMLGGIGMLARMLIVAPASTAGTRMFRDNSASADRPLAAFHARISALLERAPLMQPGGGDVLAPVPLECSHDARAVWIAFHDHAEAAIGPGGAWQPIRAWGAKAAEHAGRLAAVLAAFGGEVSVSATAMANGIELAQHYGGEMLRLAGHAGTPLELHAAQALLKWWQERGGPAHLAEVYQFGPPMLREARAARAACQTLVEHGYLVPLSAGTKLDGKARREAWTLAP